MKRRTPGFTVIEIMLAIAVLAAATVLVFIEKNNIEGTQRDTQRKTALNAMYYNLEKVYYPANNSYPDHINSGVLKAMDPDLFKDPYNVKLGEAGSDYRYIPTNCSEGKCKSYTLRTTMDREADFIKTSANK